MEPDPREHTALEYWLILYRKKFLILLVVLSSVAVAFLADRFLPKVYEANAQFFIPATPDTISFLANPGTMTRGPVVPSAAEEVHAPYIGFLKSKTLREMVRQDFPQRTLQDLKRDVSFSLSNEFIMNVYARDRDPSKAVQIANTYVRKLNTLLSQYSYETAQRNRLLLEGEVADVRRRLQESKDGLKRLRELHAFVSLDSKTSQLTSSLSDFQSRMSNTLIQQRENEGRIEALRNELAKEGELIASATFTTSTPLLEDLEKGLAVIETNIAGMRMDFREEHPEFAILMKRRDQMKASIETEIRKLVASQIKLPGSYYEKIRQDLSGLLVERQRIQTSMETCKTVIADIDRRLKELPAIYIQAENLESEVAKNTLLLKDMENRLEETRLQGKTALRSLVILAEAAIPEKPLYPNLPLNILVATLTGLLGGILYAYFIHYVEHTSRMRRMEMIRKMEASGI